MPPVKVKLVVNVEIDEIPLAFVVDANAKNEAVWFVLLWSL